MSVNGLLSTARGASELSVALFLWVAVTAAPVADSWPPPLEPDDLPPAVYLDRAGFSELVIQNSLLGGVVGFGVTQAVFGSKQPLRAFSGLPLGFGAGVLLPVLLTRGKPVHVAQAQLYNFGERWGLLMGALLPGVLGVDDGRVVWGSSAGFFGLGLAGALWAYPHLELSPGQVAALDSGHTFGALSAALLMLVFNVVPESRAAFSAPVLFFANAGMAAAYLSRDLFRIDRRRVVLVDFGGYLGALVGIGGGFLVTGGASLRGKPQIYGASMASGMVAGLVAAYLLSDDLDAFRQGVPNRQLLPQPQLLSPSAALLPSLEPSHTSLQLELIRGSW